MVATLDVTWEIELGIDGSDRDPANPVARALRSLLRAGTPIRDFRNLILTPSVSTPQPAFWLGAFVHSVAGRILFFPAVTFSGFQARYRGKPRAARSFPVDHLTLERDLRRWHLTSAKGEHFGGPTTKSMTGGGAFWFGMSVQSPGVLRRLHKTTGFEVSVPESDMARRVRLFQEIRDGAVDWWVSMNEAALSLKGPWYFHMIVLVGPRGFTVPEDHPKGLPDEQAHLPSSNVDGPVPVRTHRTEFHDGIDLELLTVPVAGALRDPIGFSTA